MSDQIWWYATRAAGLMTWATAMLSIVLGLVLSLSGGPRRWRRLPTKAWLIDIHRYVGGLSVVFLILHMVTLWADSFVHFAWAELLIPGASEWRPLAVAWGVVSAWLLFAIEASSLVKDRLPDKLWRNVHMASYVVAVFGTVHAVSAGSDVDRAIIRIPGLILLALVVGLTVGRLALIKLASTEPEVSRSEQLAKLRQSGQQKSSLTLSERLTVTRNKRPELAKFGSNATTENPNPERKRERQPDLHRP